LDKKKTTFQIDKTLDLIKPQSTTFEN